MRGIAYSVVVRVLAACLVVNAMVGRAFAQPTEQQAAPQEPAAAQEPAAKQPTIDHSGPEPAPAIAPFDAEQAKRHQEAWAKHLGVPVEMSNSIGMKFVLIPPGEFVMGISPAAPQHFMGPSFLGPGVPSLDHFTSPELRPHRVRITHPFYVAFYEVTVGQFRQFVGSEDYQTQAEQQGGGSFGFNAREGKFQNDEHYSWQSPGFTQSDQHPVVNVSWNDAAAFCAWLSSQERKQYRLPTEAQWEYACRAGTTTQFSHGDDPDQLTRIGNIADAAARANFEDWTWAASGCDNHVFTSPVGQFEANKFGLYDMHGNVLEWCADWYSGHYYEKSPEDDPTGPTTGSNRVFRGGSWDDPATDCLSAKRYRVQPYYRCSSLGFRVALDAAVKVESPEEGK